MLVEFSKAMVDSEERGYNTFLTGTLGYPTTCDSKSNISPTVKRYLFYDYDGGEVPYTLSYVESEEEPYRAKATDGTYLQNFAGMPITIIEE